MKSLILGTIVGGVIVFIWSFISWSILPWHMNTIRDFENREKVRTMIRQSAPEAGIYVMPLRDPDGSEEHMKVNNERMKTGPFVFAAINPNGVDPSMGKRMGKSLVNFVLAALCLTWLLQHSASNTYVMRLRFITIAVIAGALICHVPYWSCWGFPLDYTMVMVGDTVVGWMIAGLVLSRIIKPLKSGAPEPKAEAAEA